jgi:hypothetical protein
MLSGAATALSIAQPRRGATTAMRRSSASASAYQSVSGWPIAAAKAQTSAFVGEGQPPTRSGILAE